MSVTTKVPDSLRESRGSRDLFGSASLPDETMFADETLDSVNASCPAGKRPRSSLLSDGAMINGRYRVERVLGEGGMGVVYEVLDELHPERPLALKTIRAESVSADNIGLFKAEFETMARLRHPNVASVYDFESIQGSEDHLFTMDRVPGGDLLRATEDKPWEYVVDLIVQVCRALAYVHSRQIVHFDLKPANVIVDAEACVKVLDFGLAGAKAASTAGRIMGTPAYMAPELADRAEVDHRVDLYSLGIMMYQLLCRKLPFSGGSVHKLLNQHLTAPIIFDDSAVKRLPEWLRDIVTRLCAKQPADRYRSANMVIDALNRQGGLSYELETQETKESYVLSSRFVGREQELHALTDLVKHRTSEAGERRSPVAWVGGQSGIGKSRLMLELRRWAQLSGLPFIEASCYESGTSEHGPVISVLKQVVRLAAALGAQHLVERFAPSLGRLSTELIDAKDIEPMPARESVEAERLAVVDQVVEFLVAMADVAPFVVYINDLQWARRGTVDILSYLSQRIRQKERAGERVRTILLGSYRDDEIESTPAEGLLAALQERGDVQLVKLKLLDHLHVTRILTSMLGVEDLPEGLIDRVCRETAGNPYFAEEAMRVLVENGTIYLERGRWTATRAVGELAIPSIQEVFLRRVSMIDERSRLVVTVMAVCGQPVGSEILEKVTGMSTDELHRSLSLLLQRRMVLRPAGEQVLYQIAHDRMRQALYGSLEQERKSTLHHAIGESLEQVFAADLEALTFELALHFGRSRDRGRALHYNRLGIERAKRTSANELGIGCCRKVRELLSETEASDSQERLAVQESLGDFYHLLGSYAEAEQCFSELLSLSVEPVERVRLTRKIGDVYVAKGDLPKAVATLWDALAIVGHRRPSSKPARYLAMAGALLRHLSHRFLPWLIVRVRRPEHRSLVEETGVVYRALTKAYFLSDPMGLLLAAVRGANALERLGENLLLSEMHGQVATVYSTLGLHGSAKLYAAKSLAIAQKLESPFHVALSHSFSGIALLFRGEWIPAVERLRQARDMLQKYGDVFYLSGVYVNLCFALSYRGAYKEVLREATKGTELIERTGALAFREGLWGAFYYSRAMLGLEEKDAALEQMNDCMTCLSNMCTHICLCASQTRAGEISLAAGHAQEAIDYLEQARENRESNQLPHDYFLYLYPLLARAYLEQVQSGQLTERADRKRALTRARRYLRVGLRSAKRHPNYLAPSLLGLGLLRWLNGDRRGAEALFARSARAAEQIGSEYWLALAELKAGECLVRHGDDDVAAGRLHLERALALFEQLQMEPYVSRTRELLKQ